ncbi:MAG: hypothetical protein AAF639_44145 [Chloroflexota bacterium]
MNQRTKSIVIGLVAGALLGAVFAWVVSDGDENEDGTNNIAQLGPAEYFQLAISILNVARQFNGMLKE